MGIAVGFSFLGLEARLVSRRDNEVRLAKQGYSNVADAEIPKQLFQDLVILVPKNKPASAYLKGDGLAKCEWCIEKGPDPAVSQAMFVCETVTSPSQVNQLLACFSNNPRPTDARVQALVHGSLSRWSHNPQLVPYVRSFASKGSGPYQTLATQVLQGSDATL